MGAVTTHGLNWTQKPNTSHRSANKGYSRLEPDSLNQDKQHNSTSLAQASRPTGAATTTQISKLWPQAAVETHYTATNEPPYKGSHLSKVPLSEEPSQLSTNGTSPKNPLGPTSLEKYHEPQPQTPRNTVGFPSPANTIPITAKTIFAVLVFPVMSIPFSSLRYV